jgi:hypothetical protein
MKKTKKVRIWIVLRNILFSILAAFVIWVVFGIDSKINNLIIMSR